MASVIPSPPLGTDATAGPFALASGAATGAGPERAVAERRFRFELAAHPGSPAQARRLTRSRLTGWSVCEDTCDTAALVISELVTNAIVHTASSRIVCELHDGDDRVRIAVRDEGCAPGEPHPSPQRPEEEHGRGLLLIEALCHAWGAQEHGSGLVVWAELPRGGGQEAREETRTEARAETRDDAREETRSEAQAKTRAAAEDGTRHEARGDLGWGARPKPLPLPSPSRGGRDASRGKPAAPQGVHEIPAGLRQEPQADRQPSPAEPSSPAEPQSSHVTQQPQWSHITPQPPSSHVTPQSLSVTPQSLPVKPQPQSSQVRHQSAEGVQQTPPLRRQPPAGVQQQPSGAVTRSPHTPHTPQPAHPRRTQGTGAVWL